MDTTPAVRSPAWTTVKGRRRRKPAAAQATVSEGEERSVAGSSEDGSIEPDGYLLTGTELCQPSISPLPVQQSGLAAQVAVAEGGGADAWARVRPPPQQSSPCSSSSNSVAGKSMVGSPAAGGAGNAAAIDGAAPQRRVSLPRPASQEQQAVQDGGAPVGVARQDSHSHSALNLQDLARGSRLRSSKSDAASLSARTVHSTTQQRHSVQDTGAAEPSPIIRTGESAGAALRGGQAAGEAAGVAGTGGGAVQAPAQSWRSIPDPAAPTSAAATPATRGIGAQLFSAYLAAELRPGPSYPTADVVWGQTERDRVYNALVSVPYQLERLLLFGVAVCLDSFLAVFTLLPLRVGVALLALGRSMLDIGGSGAETVTAAAAEPAAGVPQTGGMAASKGRSQQRRRHQQHQQQQQAGARRAVQVWRLRRPQLRGDQLFDLLGAAMSLVVVLFLWNLNAGTLYFWMKDLTQELLKLSVLYTALELSDKICCSFGVDVLEALAASCTQLAAGCSRSALFAVCADVVVTTALLAVHGATLMSQAMVFGVAMNSKKNTLVALLIAANFTEIKGTVLKRFDTNKLFWLACQDVVERFHLLLILAFVIVEEMGNSGSRSPNPQLLAGCAHIYVGEVVIDIIKHAVLGKFNDIRPGVYREYMRDLCDRVSSAQSHNIHKLVGFEPFAPAALAFRIAATAAALRHTAGGSVGSGGLWGTRLLDAAVAVAGLLAAWMALVLLKVCLGYMLKVIATAYLRHYETKRGVRFARRSAALQQQVSAAAAAMKKED